MELRRLTAALCLAALATLGTATPAFAHAELKSSTPAQGASLDTPPKQVVLTFSEPVSPVEITVADSPGTAWTIGQVAVEGPVVTVPVEPAGPAGPYAIAWKVKSEDGDDISGTVNFTMTVPATTSLPTTTATTTTTTTAASTPTPQGNTNPAAPSDDSGGVPPWVWVGIGLIVLVGVGLVLFIRSRRDRGAAER